MLNYYKKCTIQQFQTNKMVFNFQSLEHRNILNITNMQLSNFLFHNLNCNYLMNPIATFYTQCIKYDAVRYNYRSIY